MSKVIDMLSRKPATSAKVLNSEVEASKFNKDMREHAEKQVQTPILDTVKDVKGNLGDILKFSANAPKKLIQTGANVTTSAIGIPAEIVAKTIGSTAQVINNTVFGVIGGAANIAQFPFLLPKVAMRPLIAASDYTFAAAGIPSQLAKKGKKSFNSGIEKAENKVLSIGKTIKEKTDATIAKIPGASEKKKAA